MLGQKEENVETENGTSVGTDTETEIRIKDGTVLGHCPTEIDIEIEKDIKKNKDFLVELLEQNCKKSSVEF